MFLKRRWSVCREDKETSTDEKTKKQIKARLFSPFHLFHHHLLGSNSNLHIFIVIRSIGCDQTISYGLNVLVEVRKSSFVDKYSENNAV